VQGGRVFLAPEPWQEIQGRMKPGFQAGPGTGLELTGARGVGQAGGLQQPGPVLQGLIAEFAEHAPPGLALGAAQGLLGMFEGGLVRGRQPSMLQGLQGVEVDIEFPGGSKHPCQGLHAAPVALEAGVEGRLHQIQHGPHPAGGDPDIVQALRALDPGPSMGDFEQPSHPGLEGPVEQDRKFRRMHAFILGRIEGRTAHRPGTKANFWRKVKAEALKWTTSRSVAPASTT